MDKDVFFVERNIRGAWVIYGALGVRQYYYHTRAESVKLYREECKRTIVEEEKTQSRRGAL